MHKFSRAARIVALDPDISNFATKNVCGINTWVSREISGCRRGSFFIPLRFWKPFDYWGE